MKEGGEWVQIKETALLPELRGKRGVDGLNRLALKGRTKIRGPVSRGR